MSRLNVLRAADYRKMPWKNGGGSTEEITRDAGESLEGFGWRLSIADIRESGGFSRFAGYQRVITVLQGDGMRLQVDGVVSEPLMPSDPYAFSGDSEVACTLLGGPIRDFNLIYHPARYAARLQWLDVRQPQRLFSSADQVLVFSVAKQLGVGAGDHPPQILGHHDCLQLAGNQELLEMVLFAPNASRCCVIELSRRSG